MNFYETLKEAIKNKKPLKITMFDFEKKIKDTDVYYYSEDGLYRESHGIGFQIETLLKEAKEQTWLIIEILE